MDGKSVGSRQRLRTITVTLEMDKEPYGNGGEEVIAIGEMKKNNFFYNMQCEDVLVKKLRVADENEIA